LFFSLSWMWIMKLIRLAHSSWPNNTSHSLLFGCSLIWSEFNPFVFSISWQQDTFYSISWWILNLNLGEIDNLMA
jgi:hypothetical protein